MRQSILVLAMVALPVVAFGQSIADSPHNLSSGSTAVTRSTVQSQLCIFCHTPHGAIEQRAIWNKTLTATTGYGGWGETETINGTAYPTGANTIAAGSRKCLSCHDGTTDVGAVQTGTDTLAGQWAAGSHINTTTGAMTNLGGAVVDPAAMAGNHPVSIPYPGSAATYNNITSGIGAADPRLAEFKTVAVAEGVGITFYTDAGGAPGIECGSCHDPHFYVAGDRPFTHVTTAGSQLCTACHTK